MRILNLSCPNITDAGLVHLKKMRGMQHLAVGRTRISDQGMVQIGQFKKLIGLDISNTDVSDGGIAVLANCHRLKQLLAFETRVTPEGAQALQKLLPALEIRRGKRNLLNLP